MSKRRTVGIDLGTTRSAIAHVVGDEPEVITNAEGDTVTPSVVHFSDDEVIVGSEAESRLASHADTTVKEIKKQMGKETDVTVGGNSYRPEQISSIILEKLVRDAGERLGDEVTEAVITVPAYFGDRERSATINAGEIAGLNVKRLLPEPSAACLAYGLREGKLGEGKQELVFVYDLGGGTFDATLVDVDYEINTVETLNTDGNNSLGGSDWTHCIIDWITNAIEADTSVDITDDPEQMGRIWEEARNAKHTLSSSNSADIIIPFVVPDQSYTFEETLTRDQFEDFTAELLEETKGPLDDLFSRADHDPEDVDKVLLAGGSTRMPQVETLVKEYFGQEPSREINPDEAVAMGAAVQAEVISDDGASAAEMLPGDTDGLVMVDVVPQSLGVRLVNGRVDHLIENDTQIPAKKRKESYRTTSDNQTLVCIEIYQGEDDHAEDNEKIGEAILEDIPPRSTSEESLACEFKINTDGTLEVQGEDLITGKEVKTTIESVVRHSDAEIQEMSDELPTLS